MFLSSWNRRPTVSAVAARLRGSAVAWTLASLGLRTGSALFLLPVVVRRLDPADIGIWYALQAIASAATLADLGMGPALTRFAAYLKAGAIEIRGRGLAPPSDNRAESNGRSLADLRATASVLYVGITAVAVVIFLTVVRIVLKPDIDGLDRPMHAIFATGCFVVASAIGIFGSRYSSLLMGLGDVSGANRVVAVMQAMQILVSAALVMRGSGLVGLGIGSLSGAIGTVAWNRARVSAAMGRTRGHFSAALLRGMLPSTFRLGAVVIGSFLINQANTLVTARTLGAAATASYGLSLQAVSLIGAGAFSFLYTKTPVFATMRQQGDLGAIRAMFTQAMRKSLAVYAVGAFTLLTLGPTLLRLIGARAEILPAAQLGVLLAVRLLESHHSSFANLIVTENEVPFVVPALLSGVAIVTLSTLFAPRFGLWAIVLVPGVVQLLWNNWWTVLRGLRGISMSGREYLRGLVPR